MRRALLAFWNMPPDYPISLRLATENGQYELRSTLWLNLQKAFKQGVLPCHL
jgi:hypothetical protein